MMLSSTNEKRIFFPLRRKTFQSFFPFGAIKRQLKLYIFSVGRIAVFIEEGNYTIFKENWLTIFETWWI
jgi:hypothetical protein